MSLKDKYIQSVGEDNDRRRKIEQLKVFEDCGFALFRFYNENPPDPSLAQCLYESAESSDPIQLSATTKSLIKEAIELIKPGKWKRITMHYGNSDFYSGPRSVMGADYYFVSLSPANLSGEYVKYKWPDGSIHFNCIGTGAVEFRYVGNRFGAKLRCNEKGKELVSAANRIRDKIRPYLSGSQEFVVLNPGSFDNKIYILFKDGTLFSQYGSEKDVIFNDSSKMEEFLIKAIKTINNSN